MKKEHQALVKWGLLLFPYILGIVMAFFIALTIPSKEKPVIQKTISDFEALEIAEKELVARYSKEVLEQKPFITERTYHTWIVEGSFHCPKGETCKGGVAKIEISATDGKVLNIEHGK